MEPKFLIKSYFDELADFISQIPKEKRDESQNISQLFKQAIVEIKAATNKPSVPLSEIPSCIKLLDTFYLKEDSLKKLWVVVHPSREQDQKIRSLVDSFEDAASRTPALIEPPATSALSSNRSASTTEVDPAKELSSLFNDKDFHFHELPSFDKYKERFLGLCADLDSISDDYKEALSVFILHYLIKGAKHPVLLPNETTNPLSLPLLDFYKTPRPTYFRSMPAGIYKLYKAWIKLQYPFLWGSQQKLEAEESQEKKQAPNRGESVEQKHKYKISLIKSKKIKRLIKAGENFIRFYSDKDEKGIYFKKNYTDRLNDAILKFREISKKKNVGRTLIDIGPLLCDFEEDKDTKKIRAKPLDKHELERRMEEVHSAFEKELGNASFVSNETFIFCGNLYFANNTAFVQFRFPDSDKKKGQIKTTTIQLRDYKNKGYRPDLVTMERVMQKEKIPFSGVLRKLAKAQADQKPKFSIPSQGDPMNEPQKCKEMVIANVKNLIAQTQLSTGTDGKYYYYYKILLEILNQYGIPEISHKDREIITRILSNSFIEINKILENHLQAIKDRKQISLETFLADIDLIFEEIILQLIFSSNRDQAIEKLKGSITKLGNCEGLSPTCQVYTSGMNAFSQVIAALYKLRGDHKKLNICYFDNSYYEVSASLLDKLKKNMLEYDKESEISTESQEIPFTSPKMQVIFADLFPNAAPKMKVGMADLDSLLRLASLDKRGEGNPLTVVVDISATTLDNDEVQKLIKNYKNAIDEGKLNLVFVASLEKLAMCGVDKYTGGMVVAYNNNKGKFVIFNDILKKYAAAEPISIEAASFLGLFMKTGKEVKQYTSYINEKTTYVYQELQEKLGTSGNLVVASREHDSIPMISLHFGKKIVQKLVDEMKETEKPEIPIKKDEIKKLREKIKPVLLKAMKIIANNETVTIDNLKEGDFDLKSIFDINELVKKLNDLKPASCIGKNIPVTLENLVNEETLKKAYLKLKETAPITKEEEEKRKAELHTQEQGKIEKIKQILSYALRDYIVVLARREKIPLSMRLSFGFAHSNISECHIALRLTVGLEDKNTLDKYIKIIEKVNNELNSLNLTDTLKLEKFILKEDFTNKMAAFLADFDSELYKEKMDLNGFVNFLLSSMQSTKL